MAETSGPFDPVDPENPVAPGEVLAENNWEWMLQHVVDGIPLELPTSTQLKPTLSASSARAIDIAPGRMLVRGHWYNNSATKTIVSNPNSSGSPRIDRAVARLNRSTNQVTAELLEGSPGGVIPILTDTATITDRPICRWTIQPGGTVATELLDERLFPTGPVLVCTSGTRPGGLVVKTGQLLYETDTGKWRGWTGSAWATLYDDSGDVALTLTAPSVWESRTPGQTARRRNGYITVDMNVRRIGSTLVTDSSDDSGGSQLTTLPVGLRPPRQIWAPVVLSGGQFGRISYRPDGAVFVQALNANVAVGRFVRFCHQIPAE